MVKSEYVKLKVGWIGKSKDPAIQALTVEYLNRLRHYAEAEALTFPNEKAMLKYREKAGTRPAYSIVLLDSRGKPVVHGARTHASAPGLYFTGYTNPISGMFRELGIDARRISKAIAKSAA